MGTRSLQASQAGIEKAKIALAQYSLSQNALAKELGLSRQPVNNFFRGKPIDRENFALICDHLGLDLENTVAISSVEASHNHQIPDSELDALVQKARQKVHANIQERCGWMKVLDMRYPIGVGAIYTDVNILEKITGKTRRELDELMQGCTPENFDRFLLGQVREQRVDGLDAVQQRKLLMILGRPGAGKTTFLKRLVTLCNQGTFLPNQVPIFVALKEFAETTSQPGLLNFISCDFTPQLALDEVTQLLDQGRGLVLLDGLDEVLEKDHDRVLREIRGFAQHYGASHIVITCRIAAREYVFEQFTDVEMADFSDEQILDFADKWFKVKEPDNLDEGGYSKVARLFVEALESHKPIKELATNPLLLTLLCLEFEQSAEFPQSRAELYERALNVLLSKWDGQRRIKRDEVYRRLPIKRKESLLGQLARDTFEQGNYFFREHLAERLIGKYIQNLPDASTDPEALLVDSHAVLKSIESQHGLLTERATGIYSFSHLTFHEYFTAKNILDSANPALQQAALQGLVKHIQEKRWREVFLLVAERMDSADYLLTLMKQQIDQMLTEDAKLQELLTWVEQKSSSVHTYYKPAAIRAFYLTVTRILDLDLDRALVRSIDRDIDITRDIGLDRDLVLARDIDRNIDRDIDIAFNLVRSIDRDRTLDIVLDIILVFILACACTLACDITCDIVLACDVGLDRALTCDIVLKPELKSALQDLKSQLTDAQKDGNQFKEWWRVTGITWIEQLRTVMITHRDIGHNWQFTDAQKQLLQQYYDANQLLVDCLNSDCYVSREVRQEIEDSLLLPIAEIEKRFPKQRRQP